MCLYHLKHWNAFVIVTYCIWNAFVVVNIVVVKLQCMYLECHVVMNIIVEIAFHAVVTYCCWNVFLVVKMQSMHRRNAFVEDEGLCSCEYYSPFAEGE